MRTRRTLAVGLAAVTAATVLGATPGPAAAAPVKVKALDNFFKPKRLEIGQGQKVKWVNRGANTHNVTVKGLGFKEDIAPGEVTPALRFPDTGVFRYFCRFHKDLGMKGKVIAGDV